MTSPLPLDAPLSDVDREDEVSPYLLRPLRSESWAWAERTARQAGWTDEAMIAAYAKDHERRYLEARAEYLRLTEGAGG